MQLAANFLASAIGAEIEPKAHETAKKTSDQSTVESASKDGWLATARHPGDGGLTRDLDVGRNIATAVTITEL